jgi:hypothetical protein
MRKHTKIYMDYFGYGKEDFCGCEVCGKRGVDIHHIFARGMGGSKEKDTIVNLMCLCRECHVEYGDKKHHIEFLIDKHEQFIYNNGKFY